MPASRISAFSCHGALALLAAVVAQSALAAQPQRPDEIGTGRFHLMEIASHGYLVIATGRIYSGPGAHVPPQRPAVPPGQFAPQATQAIQMTQAIDWALAENARKGSPLFGHIDPQQVVYSGWSCSGSSRMYLQQLPMYPRATAEHSRNPMAARQPHWLCAG